MREPQDGSCRQSVLTDWVIDLGWKVWGQSAMELLLWWSCDNKTGTSLWAAASTLPPHDERPRWCNSHCCNSGQTTTLVSIWGFSVQKSNWASELPGPDSGGLQVSRSLFDWTWRKCSSDVVHIHSESSRTTEALRFWLISHTYK